MHTNTITEPRVAAKPKLRWFTLYADFPAGIRARHLLNRATPLIGGEWEISAEMWKLDSVAPAGPIHQMIAQEAGESDVLLIAVSSVDQPDSDVTRWLESLVNWKANRIVPGLLAGFLGDADHEVDEENWMVNCLAAFAQRTQMEFAWSGGGRDSVIEATWLKPGLETLLTRKRVSGC